MGIRGALQAKFDVFRLVCAPCVEVCGMRLQPSKAAKEHSIVYPLEVLGISENQRIKNQPPDLVQKIIKECAMTPVDNFRNVENSHRAWNFDRADRDNLISSCDIAITSTPLMVRFNFEFFGYFKVF